MAKPNLTIVFVTNNYTPYEGGVVSHIKAYVSELRKHGHTVFVVTLDFAGGSQEEQVITVFCPVQFKYKFGPVAIPWQATKELESIFLRLNPDIVHVHHPFVLGSAALNVCQKMGLPTVFTHHTQYDACLHYVPGPSGILSLLVHQRVFTFCQRVTHIIAPSTFVQNRLINQGITSPITILPSPLLPIFSQNVPIFGYKKPGSIKKLLYVGRFTEEKNIPILLQLIKKLPENRFSLTLVGYGHLERELIRYAYEELKLLSEQVIFVKKPEKSVLCLLYKESDLFVFASKTEGNPVVFAEAMAAGTPVISLRGNWHSDQLVDGVNGFWVNSIDDMVDRVLALERDQELFGKLQYGAWQAGHYFGVENLTTRLENLYGQVIHDFKI